MDDNQEVEKKLGLSLDELIALQKAKGSKKPAGGKKKTVQKVQTKGGGRVLVAPRPKGVPRPGQTKAAVALKGTRGGGVQKGGGPAPKFLGSRQQGGGQHARQGSSRNVKVTIGNKLSGRPSHIPTSGVLSKPFMGSGSRGSNGRAPMQLEGPPAGASLSTRFDSIQGVASSGPARPTGVPRRNAHGVLLP